LILLIERFVIQVIACALSFCAYVFLDTAYRAEGFGRSIGLLERSEGQTLENLSCDPPRAVSSLLNQSPAHHQRVREKGLPYHPSWTQ
jgi:hypothetical protein